MNMYTENGPGRDDVIVTYGTSRGKPGKKEEKVRGSIQRLEQNLAEANGHTPEALSALENRLARLAQLQRGARFHVKGTLSTQYYRSRTNGKAGQPDPALPKNGYQELRGGVGENTPIVPDEVVATILEEEHFMKTAEDLLRERGQEL
jgi:hypothetical protein